MRTHDSGMTDPRPYRAEDRTACLALFDSNTPTYFTPDERPDFDAWLGTMDPATYRVIERDGRVAACGGVAMEPDGATASLCWGMVDQGLHRQGLGQALTQARLNAARALGATAVRCDTSHKTRAFYERFGFVVERIEPDGYGPGLDRCEMRLAL